MNILYRTLAVVGGLVAGGATVAAVEALGSVMHPMPEGLKIDDRQAMQQWVAALPTSGFVMLLIAWGAGCVVGAVVSRWIAPQRSALPAVIVCGLLTLATIFNLAVLPHPWWMWPGGILACLAGGLVGVVLAAPKQYLVQTSRTIQAPIDKVFQTLSNVEYFSKAVSGITNIEFVGTQEYGVGTRFKETRLMNGRSATTELEVTEQVQNERIRMVSDTGGAIWDTVFTVEQQPSAVLMQMQMAARPHAVTAKLLTPLILGMVEKAVASDMDDVKSYCESQAE